MSALLRLYLNAEIASSLLFISLALWGGLNALRNQAITLNYGAALAISQAILVALGAAADRRIWHWLKPGA